MDFWSDIYDCDIDFYDDLMDCGLVIMKSDEYKDIFDDEDISKLSFNEKWSIAEDLCRERITTVSQTYIITDASGLFKIGKAKDIDKRMKAYETHNPSVKLIAVCFLDVEKELHKRYKNFRVNGEWFKLEKSEISSLIQESKSMNEYFGHTFYYCSKFENQRYSLF